MFRLGGLTSSPRPTPPPDPYTALPRQRHANRARRMSVPNPSVAEEPGQPYSHDQVLPFPSNPISQDVGMKRGISKTRGRYVSMPDFGQLAPLDRGSEVSAPVDRRHPRAVVSNIEEILGNPEHVKSLLDIDDLEAHYERDLMECQQRAAARQSTSPIIDEWQANFGISLREVWMSPNQSVSTVIGGVYKCELPVVVFECVEELFRRKCNRIPERAVLIKTRAAIPRVEILRTSSIADVWSTLLTYLSSLPSPLLSPSLSEAVRRWCLPPWGPEETRVRISRLILNLLPTPNFSLFIYTMAFLHWVSRGGHGIPETIIHALEGIYASRLGEGPGETITGWFLARWSGVSEGLSQSRLSEDRALWMPSKDLPGDFFGVGVGLEAWSRDVEDGDTDTEKSQQDIDRAISNILPASPNPEPEEIVIQDEDYELQYQKDLNMDSISLYSTLARTLSHLESQPWLTPTVDERLLDLALPPCMDESFTIHSYPDQPLEPHADLQTPASDRSSISSASTQESSAESGGLDAAAARQRIRQLECELERNDSVLQDALEETFRTRERLEELEGRQAALEDECGRLRWELGRG
ncbi:hypothetical protein BD779DRAFT_1551129 [Infundibulicybe gibba]|nr:hypothetical protein BD779DRAFT_1551129 [Infundibulicybe gibba]